MSEFATLYLEEIPADETTGEGVTEVEAHDGQDGPAETAEPEGGAAAEAGAGGTKKKKKKKRRGRKRAELKWGCRSVHGDPRPAGRGGSALALCDGQLYLFGGANLRSAHFSDTWAFDPRTRTWELLFRNGDWTGPSARSGHSCTVLGRKVVLFGGAELSNAAAVYNDAHVFDTETRAWARLAVEGEPPSPRNGHTAVAVDDHTMAVFGGSSPEDGQFNDLYTLQLDRGGSSGRWAKVEWDGEGPAERDLHAAAALRCAGAGGAAAAAYSMHVCGGRGITGSVFADSWEFVFGAGAWRRLGDMPGPRCSHAGAFVRDGNNAHHLCLHGGWDGEMGVYGSLLVLDTGRAEWSVSEVSEAKRFGQCAAGDGERIFVFGGINPARDFDDMLILEATL